MRCALLFLTIFFMACSDKGNEPETSPSNSIDSCVENIETIEKQYPLCTKDDYQLHIQGRCNYRTSSLDAEEEFYKTDFPDGVNLQVFGQCTELTFVDTNFINYIRETEYNTTNIARICIENTFRYCEWLYENQKKTE